MKPLLFRLACSPLARFIIGWIFTHMSWSIPVERLYETDSLLAFHHPNPSYPTHILIVPKRSYENILAIQLEDSDFQRDLFATVQKLVRDFSLESGGYRLICNGGAYQDVPIVHFHLISDISS